MSHQFTVSKQGRRLIKAFEGFRPVDRTLVTGQRVVGYGHKVRRPEAMALTRSEANALLKSDLAPYEDMINTEVHAPLNQNQFDALVSLAFSIGPKAFLESSTIHLLNNGRPLDAARSIEIWRKSRIDGKAYVIDALVRRRAQEKALFLRPIAGTVPASRVYLQALEDSEMSARLWDDNPPVFEDENAGYVASVPYDADDYTPLEDHLKEGHLEDVRLGDDYSGGENFEEDPLANDDLPAVDDLPEVDDYREVDDRPEYYPEAYEPETQKQAVPLSAYSRRREDGPAGVLTLSEVIDDDYDIDDGDDYEEIIDIDDILVDDTRSEPSPIAVAAAEVSDRLDALIGEDAPQESVSGEAEWPESLITADAPDSINDFLHADTDEITLDDVDAAAINAPPVEPNVYESNLDEMDAGELRKIARDLTVDADAADTDPAIFEPSTLEIAPPDREQAAQPRGLGPYLIMIVTGLTLMGASLGAMLRGGTTRLGEAMPFWSAVGLIVGAAILLFALYYILKSILRRA